MSDEQNPYQSPQAIELSHGYLVAPSAGRGGAPFASGRSLAFVAVVMVALVVLASLWLAASSYMQVGLLERAAQGIQATASEATSNDTRQHLAAILRQVLYWASAVTFLMWFYRAYRNLPALGNAHLAHSPSGAVGWWFVPIAYLVVPCQIALEIWRGSDPKNLELKWPQKPASAWLVGVWWTLYLLMNITFSASSFTHVGEHSPRSLNSLLAESWVVLVASLIALPAGIFAILFIRGVDRNQDERIRLVNERAPASLTTPTELRLSEFLDKMSAPIPPGDDSPFAPRADRP
jgi:hypothetical protein